MRERVSIHFGQSKIYSSMPFKNQFLAVVWAIGFTNHLFDCMTFVLKKPFHERLSSLFYSQSNILLLIMYYVRLLKLYLFNFVLCKVIKVVFI